MYTRLHYFYDMNIRSSLFIILLSLVSITEAQNQFILKGHISDTTTSLSISEVHIINRSTEQGSITNTQGYFKIKVHQGDEIIIHHISYEPYILYVKNEDNVRIKLKPRSHQIAEITLHNKSWEQFKLEFVQAEFEKEKSSGLTIEGLKQYKGPPMGFKPSLVTAIYHPISFVHHFYNKKARQKRKTKRYQKIINNRSYLDD